MPLSNISTKTLPGHVLAFIIISLITVVSSMVLARSGEAVDMQNVKQAVSTLNVQVQAIHDHGVPIHREQIANLSGKIDDLRSAQAETHRKLDILIMETRKPGWTYRPAPK